MSLSNGRYLIQFVPPSTTFPYTGGLYATRGSVNSPILASSLRSGNTTDQVWQVNFVTGSENTYSITEPIAQNIHIGPVIFGFGLDSSSNNIILGGILDWVVTQVDATNNVFIIAEPTHQIGSTNDVTVSNGQLVVEEIALGDNKDPLPQWQFIKINDLD